MSASCKSLTASRAHGKLVSTSKVYWRYNSKIKEENNNTEMSTMFSQIISALSGTSLKKNTKKNDSFD